MGLNGFLSVKLFNFKGLFEGHFFTLHTWKRHHAPFAYQMSVVTIVTCIQYIYTKTDHLPENVLQNHGFS